MGTLTIYKTIPAAKEIEYQNLGWVTHACDERGSRITKVVRIASDGVKDFDQKADRPPYLVQRARIRRPLGQYAESRLSEAVAFDYMGAAEFEFGALPTALRVVEAQFQLYRMYKLDGLFARINSRDHVLRVFGNFDTDEQREAYFTNLRNCITTDRASPLKEPLCVRYADGRVHLNTSDFWFDIRNAVFFSFDKQFMSRLHNNLLASFRCMNEAVQSMENIK